MALSTSFAWPTTLEPIEVVDALLRSGCGGVVFAAGLTSQQVDPLALELARRRDELPVVAVESPCPFTPASRASLSSPDRDEAAVALACAQQTIRRAETAGARAVVVRLGVIEPLTADWIWARDRFLRGKLELDQVVTWNERRDRIVDRYLDGGNRALEVLTRDAERAGLLLLLRNGRRPHELPGAREVEALLKEWSSASVAPLFDAPGAHLLDVMGFQAFAGTLAAFGDGPFAYLADACAAIGGLAPGRGLLDMASLADRFVSAQVVFSPWAGSSLDEAVSAVEPLSQLMQAAHHRAIARTAEERARAAEERARETAGAAPATEPRRD